ncbi:unnamed protein product [Orchesella dallaii]|uniref:F-box domain-containing protein n=1 Tax=Orchesella dallaii TaxID=48710 RepID=A0ABP1QLS0_9HEXA
MATLDMLPNEVLCNILGMLSTIEKFRAREVCRDWRDVVDEIVPFYGVKICDENHDEVALRFGKRRVLSLEFSCDCDHGYTRNSIPIKNLSFLKRVVLLQNIHVNALVDLITRADKLIELEIRNGDDSHFHGKDKTAALLPALRKIKKLVLPNYDRVNQILLFNSWKHIIQSEMPKLQQLEIHVLRYNSNYPNFFELSTIKPDLCEFVVQNKYDLPGFSITKRVTAVWNAESHNSNSKGLRKLMLLGDASYVLLHRAPEILDNQNNLEELQLYDFYVPNPDPGYRMSLIEPVLTNNMETLHTIRLSISRSWNDFDMEIFAHLPTLRELHLSLREIKYTAMCSSNRKNYLRGIKNCSTVISATLCKLVLQGFKFSAKEANDCIKEIAKLDLEKVDFFRSGLPEIATVWMWFSSRVCKMGLKKEVQAKTLYLPVELAGVELHFKHKKTSTC